jgi:phage-related protein
MEYEKVLRARFYCHANGKEPVREWLLALTQEERKIIGTDIKVLEMRWPVGMPLCKSLGKGLYEVRSSLPGNKIARVFFYVTKSDMILIHGFIKKTQKTPLFELTLARERLKRLKNVS